MSATSEDKDAIIAALRTENAVLRERQAARDVAFDERAAHQAATIDVLKAMSASPGDPQPVFDLIVQQVRTLLDTPSSMLFEYDGTLLHFRADAGTADLLGRDVLDELLRDYPMAPHRGIVSGRAILDAAVVHVRDLTADPDRSGAMRALPYRSQISVPLLRDGRPIGVLTSASARVDSFSQAQVELLKTFAEQAVIAIISAETYRALQVRTADLQESLEYQTATADVLKVISHSTFDLDPVLATVAETSARLCAAESVAIFRRKGDLYRLAVSYGFPPEYREFWDERGPVPIDPNIPTVGYRCLIERRPVHVEDVADVPGYPVFSLSREVTALGVPLLRDGEPIGNIVLARTQKKAFSQRQIDLVSTLADQAVIAIENTRLLSEQREALERQTATAEVLEVINASPGNLTPVFDAVLEKALRLCGASIGGIYSYHGCQFEPAAFRGITPEFAAFNGVHGSTLVPGGILETILRTRRPAQVPDLKDTDRYRNNTPYTRALVDLGGIRALLDVPLLKDGEVIGVITIFRDQPGIFTDKQIALLENFAAQAVIAMENARLLTEQKDALEQQTATAEVLGIINASPGDLTPVFEEILEKAHRICRFDHGALALFDGTHFRAVATRGYGDSGDAWSREPYLPSGAQRLVMRGARYGHIPDISAFTADPDDTKFTGFVALTGFRATLLVPLRKDDAVIGHISGWRLEPGPFSDNEIALLENFAAQAVIAMDNARLLNEQREALEQQTATAEVLQAINTSPGNLAPVFDAMLEKAMRLCGVSFGMLRGYDGEQFYPLAARGLPEAYAAFVSGQTASPGRGSAMARALETGLSMQELDIREEAGYKNGAAGMRAIAELGGGRTVLHVPLVKDLVSIGFFTFFRQEVRAFSDKEIALLENFAAQAVIAMENARLLTETREALEQQTATAELLRTINESPGNTQPVFDAMLEKATQLCGVALGFLSTWDGEVRNVVAVRGLPPAMRDYAAARVASTPSPGVLRVLETRRPHQIVDLMDDDGYRNGHPDSRAIVDLGGVRTCLNIPLVKDDAAVGLFSFYRRDVREFSGKEIALLENFAAQAVIAMENARLLTEQREALEQQTATAEVLQVINASPGDLEPVFDAMLEKAMRLCGVAFGSFHTWDGEATHFVAMRGFPPDIEAYVAARGPSRAPGPWVVAMAETRRPYQYDDFRTTEAYLAGQPDARAFAELGGVRSGLLVPLLKDQTLIGYVAVYRLEVRPFSDKEIALLENFAAQAVIAMDNARLLTEQREALERQTATAEVLGVINRSPGDLTPVFDAVLERALRLCGAYGGGMFTVHDMRLKYFAFRGMPDAFAMQRLNNELPVSVDAPPHRMMQSGRTVTVVDTATDPWFAARPERQRETTGMGGARSVLNVPFMKDGSAVGGIALFRETPGEWPDRQVALLENFAAQAVIAMENARLLTEQREALEQQTATADLLRVINSSPGDLAPVFAAILDKAHALCGTTVGSLFTFDGQIQRAVATHGLPEEYAALLRRGVPINDTARRITADGTRPGQILDIRAIQEPVSEHSHFLFEQTDVRTILFVPLRKESDFLGYISAMRPEVRAFSDKEIALLENFAAQAVIAMENARLLTEQREALERQTAMSDVLQVINASPGNLTPVFDSILERAHSICGAAMGSLFVYDDGKCRSVATHGFPDAFVARLRQPFPPSGAYLALIRGDRFVQVPDIREVWSDTGSEGDTPTRREQLATLRDLDARTLLLVPMRKDTAVVGFISAYRAEVRQFAESEIALLESFAAQAVIAIENARLLNEIRQRQSELDITFENMGDGVAMFDADQKLAAWNRNFQDILDLPDDAVRVGLPFADYIRGLAERGEYGPDASADEQIVRLTAVLNQANRFERARPNGHVIDIRQNPIPGGGFVIIYADITERKRAEEGLRAARDEAETALRELKLAQANLVQAEKMASLGQLTAGIAHEIKNPLNFVNNFASLSVELLDELKETAAPGFATLDGDARADVEDLTETLTGNLKKIEEHGKRADGIVRSMLEHSRGSSTERRAVDINDLVDEALNLAYHGARAQDQSFNITLERDLAPGIAPVTLAPQDMTRVLLNLIGNGFYATRKRREAGVAGFEPTLKVATRDLGDAIEFRVRDNGIGIPPDIRDKLFQPFFTTKPTGEGTGLGLSITWDVVTKAHGGTIAVDSEPGDHTEFTVTLPRHAADRARP